MAEEFTTPRADFGEWYQEVLRQSDIVDDRYPIKGCLVWKGWGFSILHNIMGIVRREVERTGHDEVQFPAMIPEDAFQTEGEHIKGFEGEVFWITHAGLNKLDRRLLLRPTSETVMYPMFALWVRSRNDLPLRVFQIVNTFRYETKHTRPILRVREIVSFYESHTAHATWEDAERQVADDISVMEEVARRLCLPIIINKRPDWDKFPGAVYTLGVDTLFPDMRTLQIGTMHNLGENFSKPFGISYKDEKDVVHYASQTCYGMSERLVAAVIAVHGDDRGLVLPPELAPKQVVVVPIIFSDTQEAVLAAARTLKGELERAGLRVALDDREGVSAGEKYNHWELRGVPVRIEVGPKDLAKQAVMAVRRDNRKKESIPCALAYDAATKSAALGKPDALASRLRGIFAEMAADMLKAAEARFRASIVPCDDIREAAKLLEAKKGMVAIHWCGDMSCAQDIEKTTEAAFLGIPYQAKDRHEAHCTICGKGGAPVTYVSRKY